MRRTRVGSPCPGEERGGTLVYSYLVQPVRDLQSLVKELGSLAWGRPNEMRSP